MGACTGFTTVVIDPGTFNIHDGLGKLISVCVLAGALNVVSWLKTSPLPIGSEVGAVTTVAGVTTVPKVTTVATTEPLDPAQHPELEKLKAAVKS
jgi:hypothetical protein